MMPISITVGALFYKFFMALSFLTPYLIFGMLFFTYCALNLKQMRLSRLHIWLLLIQIPGSLIVFFILSPINITLAQGVMICVLAPTGTAAPVITGMLKGNVGSLTAYSLVSNMCVALAAPIIFSLVGSYQNLPFFESFMAISQRVFVLLFLPLALAMVLQKVIPRATAVIASYSSISFYLWSLALCVVTGRMVVFILNQNGSYATEVLIAAGALVVCAGQFLVGRALGKNYDDTIAGGQGLGQKNTILAIWMAQMYLNPISSIGPGAYVLWQNLINSWQVWLHRKNL